MRKFWKRVAKMHEVEGYRDRPELTELEAQRFAAWQSMRAYKFREDRVVLQDVVAYCVLHRIESETFREMLEGDVAGLEQVWFDRMTKKSRPDKEAPDAESETGDRREGRTLGRS